MRKIKLLGLIPGLLILFITSCEDTEIVEPVDYTYSISKIAWSNPIDNNNDGYATNRELSVFVNLAEDVTRVIEVRVYFRGSGGAAYSFYSSVSDIEFSGLDSPLAIQMMIGPPNRELITGIYDFRIELYESGSEQIEAIAEKTDADIEGGELLGDQKFEALSSDQIYNIKVRWENINDENGNGYATDASLFVDVNLEQDVTKEIKVELHHKEMAADKYTLYQTSPLFQIQFDDTADVYEFGVGTPPKELQFGVYDFKIVVYETGVFSPVAILDSSSADPMADSIRGRKFETGNDDSYFYSINTSSIYWSDRYDYNNNGFTAVRNLNFNVDVDKDEQREIWIQVYYKEIDSANFIYYDSYFEQSPWQIKGANDSTDFVTVEIGTAEDTTKNLHKNEYDFLVNVLEAYDSLVVTSVSEAESDSLLAQPFETAYEDSL